FRTHRQRPIALIALALVAIAGIALLSHITFHVHSPGFWIIVLVGGAILLGASRREHAPQTTTVVSPTTGETTTTVVAAPPRKRRNPFPWGLAIIGLLFPSAAIAAAAYRISYLEL